MKRVVRIYYEGQLIYTVVSMISETDEQLMERVKNALRLQPGDDAPSTQPGIGKVSF